MYDDGQIDHDYEAKGVAQLNVDELSTVRLLRAEKIKMEKKDPHYWELQEIQDDALARIQAEFWWPDIARSQSWRGFAGRRRHSSRKRNREIPRIQQGKRMAQQRLRVF